jgi:phage tail-like protein
VTVTLPVRHILLRDATWLGRSTGLERAADGSLALLRVPAPDAGSAITHDGPYEAQPSGIVAHDELNVFISDTDGRRIHVSQRQCGATFTLEFGGIPAGMALHAGMLHVADRERRCIRRFVTGEWRERTPVGTGLVDPVSVEIDGAGRIYVLDRGAKRVVRFEPDGSVDARYAPAVTTPLFMALADDHLFVSDAAGNVVWLFDSAGATRAAIEAAGTAPAMQPGALAVQGSLLLVADAAGGDILVFDSRERVHLGRIGDFSAPVAAMRFDTSGNLLLKLDGAADYRRFAAGTGRLSHGRLVAGPFDAGENNDWERASMLLGATGGAVLSTFVAATRAAPVVWRAAPGLDCLVAPDPGPAPDLPGSRRYLWLRAELEGNGRDSAVLEQVAAETKGESYLDDLPRIYRRDDAPTRFLERWLALFRAQLDDRERHLADAARDFDPAAVPARHLERTAAAVAFALPPDTMPEDARAVLARIPDLYARRGTLEGLADQVELHSGIRPQIFEDFRARRVWQLGTTSLLGLDTQLAAATPDGFVVPRDARTDPGYAGLRGEYHAGVEFHEPVLRRTDPTLDFADLEVRDPRREAAPLLDRCSVRWEGQIRPRFSETCLLTFRCHGGLRVWLDGLPLIARWELDSAERSLEARVVLDASRWHELRIEFGSLRSPRPFRFSWSSRHQRAEAVPRECLYSILDGHADPGAAPPSSFDVGHAVVGESMPLAVSEFGNGLSSDYAHLFTVVAPAGSCRDEAARAALRAAIDAEKPAHADYHLCFVEPRMRVGFQARLGIDTFVASGPPPLRLDATRLDRDSFLNAREGTRLGERARLGHDTVVG